MPPPGWSRSDPTGFGRPSSPRERFRRPTAPRSSGPRASTASRRAASTPARLDVVGADRGRLVDRRALRHRLGLLHRSARCPATSAGWAPTPTRSPSSSARSSSPPPRSCSTSRRSNAPATRCAPRTAERPPLLDLGTRPHRLVGERGATRRHRVLQRHHVRGHRRQPRHATQAHRLVWVPDVLGSICFLVASGLAWSEVSHGWWSWHARSLSWRIAALNLAGSIAFGVSAVASKIVTTTGEPRNIMLVNLGTAVGGLCFLVGALLLLPERTAPVAGLRLRSPLALNPEVPMALHRKITDATPIELNPLYSQAGGRGPRSAPHAPGSRDRPRRRVPDRARRADARRQRAAQPRDVRDDVDGAAGRSS